MVNTSARLLQLLSLLSTRQSWTCADLAAQLEITERTVRRDISRLRELGYGIESEMGPWGGYHLGPGTSIPPLILDEEEALAVAVGLRTAAFSGVSGSDQAALSALQKLRQVLPARIADRLGELDAAFTHTARPDDSQISPALLLDLATACRRGERTRLTYRDGAGTTSTRRVDPHRLIYTGRRWYLLAFCGASRRLHRAVRAPHAEAATLKRLIRQLHSRHAKRSTGPRPETRADPAD
ncbi:helix-turn-helix transcriptional regulator [Nonomuraea fuscirosea]|uniref:helix-turn-helix transcriptional regulator n=1 Tax=Nonomuraea fuscirosea TaxID=1291556 RepID=UPI003478BD77